MTPTGRGAFVVGILAVVAGWWLGQPGTVGIGIALVTAVGVALVLVRSRTDLDVVRHLTPDRVVVGDPATAHLEVTNPSGRGSGDRSATERYGNHTIEVPIPRLAAGATTTVAYDLPTRRRGIVQVGPLVIRRADPLGLVRAERHHGEVDALWVHPRHHVVPPLPSRISRSLDGPDSRNAPQGTITFHAIRDYVRGDDLRHIHWRTSARMGSLMVRQLVDTSFPFVTVLLDLRPDAHDDHSFEVAMEVAASVVLACSRANFPVTLRTTGGHHVGSTTEPLVDRATLDLLASLEPMGAPDALRKLVEAVAVSGSGSAAVVVTGAVQPRELARLVALGRRFPTVAAVALDHADRPAAPPRIPGVTVVSAADGADFARRWRTGVTT